jgi:predicted  nucleic acid-binding Zn-ribbon protein
MDELEEIKKAVSTKPVYEPMGAEPLPHEVIDLNKMIEETPNLAPLFIRIDRYKQILSNIEELKSTIKELRDLLAIRKEIHRINFETDDKLEKALQRFSGSTSDFSREFVNLRGVKHFVKEPLKEEAADGTISKLGEEIVKLKEELEKLEI